jgi:aminomethyltransferase
MSNLHKTPLFDWHVSHQGRMVGFGGWEMPVQYSSVIDEHITTRTAVGLTDVSHMGRLKFEGEGAGRLLDGFLTRNVAVIKPGQVRYSLVTNEQGGIIDDVLISRFESPQETGGEYYLLVVNASNREKVLSHLHRYLMPGVQKNVTLTDLTFPTAMFAVQGPKAVELLQPFVDVDLATIKYYNGLYVSLDHPKAAGRKFLLTRTGYTGEDGFEICVDADIAPEIWDVFLHAGQPFGAKPVGLGARDTLRLEAALPLYGHELSETITPFEAGLSYALHLAGPQFPGSGVLAQLADQPPARVRIGFELEGKRPAREGCEIYHDGEAIGIVTSGTFAPTLNRSIGMGYVPPEFSEPGTAVEIDIRGKKSPAKIVPLPFYARVR